MKCDNLGSVDLFNDEDSFKTSFPKVPTLVFWAVL